MSELLNDLLGKPVGPSASALPARPGGALTASLEVTGDEARVELKARVGDAHGPNALAHLKEQGLNPDEWEQVSYRRSEWTMPNGEPGESARFSFRRIAGVAAERPPIDDLLAAIDSTSSTTVYEPTRPERGEHTFIVALGDMQFGKIDGDGVEGTLQRTIAGLNRAADLLGAYRARFDIEHVHIAWLGDHIEGFVSMGGQNAWRTQLTLNEQIRLTRRVMLHALLVFAPLAKRLTMAAVPGNHGEAIRFGGSGVTRFDDSHDTESLIAVKDAADLNPERFGHVEFFVPDTDELTVLVECSGTVVAHAHGHKWKTGKHFAWWQAQAFDQTSAMHQADVLLAGHMHHEFIESEGPRTFIQVPAMEADSAWYRHTTGSLSNPGLIVAVTKDGAIPVKEVVR